MKKEFLAQELLSSLYIFVYIRILVSVSRVSLNLFTHFGIRPRYSLVNINKIAAII